MNRPHLLIEENYNPFSTKLLSIYIVSSMYVKTSWRYDYSSLLALHLSIRRFNSQSWQIYVRNVQSLCFRDVTFLFFDTGFYSTTTTTSSYRSQKFFLFDLVNRKMDYITKQ